MKRFLAAILICAIMVGVLEVKVSASEIDKKTPSGIAYSGIEQKIKEERLLVVVADNGVKIADKLKDTMFDAFVSGDESRSSKGGSGLGLAITKSIVKKHGGNLIYVEPYQNYTKAFIMQFDKKVKHDKRKGC